MYKPKKPFKINIDKEELEEILSNCSIRQAAEKLNVSYDTIVDRIKFFNIDYKQKRPIRQNFKLTEESRKRISDARKKWMKENPDKHPWRNKDKFKSKPCENAKKFLRDLNIDFIPEFYPEIPDRFFSIDIALPDKMIAIEINGNQHYERDGRLKSYYQERHDLLEAAGWIVYEVHYSCCFDLEKWSNFVEKIKSTEKKVEFDYFNYVPRKQQTTIKKLITKPKKVKNEKIKTCHPKKEPSLCSCGRKKGSRSENCYKCNSLKRIGKGCKINWPNPEDLQKLLWEKSTVQIAKELGVSDKAVEKFCKRHGLTKPPRGYWMKNPKVS